MTFFDILRTLFFFTSKKVEIDQADLQLFQPYMVNRWLSFYDRTKAVFVNETLNKFTDLFDNKEDSFKLYDNLIPRSKFKKIEYVKKQKEMEVEQEFIMFAKNNMVSLRELNMYVALQKHIDIS